MKLRRKIAFLYYLYPTVFDCAFGLLLAAALVLLLGPWLCR
jgi:hypothetical protein